MALTYYGKRAVKWLLIALSLFAATVAIRELTWAEMLAGGGYAVAFSLVMITGILATVALGVSIFFAMAAVK